MDKIPKTKAHLIINNKMKNAPRHYTLMSICQGSLPLSFYEETTRCCPCKRLQR